MEVILLENVANLGGLGDQVTVKPGYGRNFLVPKGKAVPATAANIADFESRRAELQKEADAQRKAAEARAEGINALAQDWSNDNNFANPPWALIPQVIAKVIADRAECTVITPVFPAQAWFWSLWGLAVCEPILLPTHGHSMMYLGPDPEPLRNKRWRLAAWKIAGKNA